MHQLWSPWRSTYITRAPSQSCFLCELALNKEESAESLVIAYTEHCIVTLNRYPYNAGHLLIAPQAHHADYDTLEQTVLKEIAALTQQSIRVLRTVMNAQGYNVGLNLGSAAGAGVPGHLHQHVVPRWNGDTNFMPTLGDVKVLSERMHETWEKLHAAWKETK